jgi:hypothetical protein
MSIKPLFANPNLLHSERVSSEPDRITIIVKTKSKQALYPKCHSPIAHLHSRYVRRLADLPRWESPSDWKSKRVFTVARSHPYT